MIVNKGGSFMLFLKCRFGRVKIVVTVAKVCLHRDNYYKLFKSDNNIK